MYWYCILYSDYSYLAFSFQHLSVYTRLKITVFSSFKTENWWNKFRVQV